MSKNAAQQLIDYGQSLWYDNISREILGNGEITRMIAEWGVRGMTSNPTIFDQAISGGSSYDPQIAELKAKDLSPEQAKCIKFPANIWGAALINRGCY